MANGAGPGDVVTNVAEFAENLLTLAELQARLAAIELKQNVQAVKVGGGLMLVGGGRAGIAGLPIALAGIAELLVSVLGMNRGAALLAVAVAAFAIAGTCVAIAAARLRGSDVGFPLTKEEFTRNLNWVRTVLLHSGRSAQADGVESVIRRQAGKLREGEPVRADSSWCGSDGASSLRKAALASSPCRQSARRSLDPPEPDSRSRAQAWTTTSVTSRPIMRSERTGAMSAQPMMPSSRPAGIDHQDATDRLGPEHLADLAQAILGRDGHDPRLS